MIDKQYMDTIWNKVRWHEYQRYQKEEAERIDRLIKKKERKVKLQLFGSLSVIITVLAILFNFDLSVVLLGGALLLIVAIYYENIIEMKIIRRINNENSH